MKYKLIMLPLMVVITSCTLLSNPHMNSHRVIHVGNMTDNTYKVTVFDAHYKSHEPALLPPGATQYMFSRTEKIAQITFEPQHPVGLPFNIKKPLSEMWKVNFKDTHALSTNFNFYILEDNTVKTFPAISLKDKQIIEEFKKHHTLSALQNDNNSSSSLVNTAIQ